MSNVMISNTTITDLDVSKSEIPASFSTLVWQSLRANNLYVSLNLEGSSVDGSMLVEALRHNTSLTYLIISGRPSANVLTPPVCEKICYHLLFQHQLQVVFDQTDVPKIEKYSADFR